MLPQWIIEKKRDGQVLTAEEIHSFVEGFTRGTIPDYQVSAFAMAVYFRGMEFEEVTALTDAMMRSGDVLDLSSIALPKADKHSTGGIGDKVSLVLAPLAACCGVAVPMISGRGLGITGGTLDKLESIPGYRTNLSPDEFRHVLAKCGCSIIGQTDRLAPADKKLYALRDVTGTVPSIPLISASIMSKKLAEGTDALVLDVKWGRGAFMKTIDAARELARTMVEIGRRMDKKMTAVITDMNQPLGRSAGNALEIVEVVETLRGQGPADLVEETLALGSHMLLLTGRAATEKAAVKALQAKMDSGAAWKKFCEMVRLHGGDVGSLEKTGRLPAASFTSEYPADRSGYVTDVDAEKVGRACVVLGAGRRKAEDRVDPAAGMSRMVKIGEKVSSGDPLALLHGGSKSVLKEAEALLAGAFCVGKKRVPAPPLVVEVIA